jgi:hypothetical protein
LFLRSTLDGITDEFMSDFFENDGILVLAAILLFLGTLILPWKKVKNRQLELYRYSGRFTKTLLKKKLALSTKIYLVYILKKKKSDALVGRVNTFIILHTK